MNASIGGLPAEGNVHVESGCESCECFEFEIDDNEIDDKRVFGWMAVLESGSRSRAGFTIIRRGEGHQGMAKFLEAAVNFRPIGGF